MSHFLAQRVGQLPSQGSVGSLAFRFVGHRVGGTLAPETEEAPCLLESWRNEPCPLDLGGRSNVRTSESLSGSFFPSVSNGSRL